MSWEEMDAAANHCRLCDRELSTCPDCGNKYCPACDGECSECDE